MKHRIESFVMALAFILFISFMTSFTTDADMQSNEVIREQIVDKNKILHRRDALLVDGVAMVGLDGKS